MLKLVPNQTSVLLSECWVGIEESKNGSLESCQESVEILAMD